MITIIRGEETRVVSTLFRDELQEGDLVGIDDIHEVASNMDEYLEFMENAFTIGFNVVSGDLDSRKAIGKVMTCRVQQKSIPKTVSLCLFYL